ncbi:MAG: hypothetical protein A3F10_06955 [Coxiella sp. RIFCSPHIGHO2_12_FULL_42_15]|nr:MAG: hypothetical protein A3F10_06955 [Coxiella sp. RIFCSPHIGHO2_12_FULL_42_15]
MIKAIKKQLAKTRKIRGFNDVLSFLFLVNESIILHKDGGLSQHFYYQAPDLESSIEEEVFLNSQTWQQALAFLGDGWMVETNVITIPFYYETKPREFDEIVSAIIDDEHILQFQSGQYLKSQYYLSITWKPVDLVSKHARKFILNTEKNDTDLEKTIQQFETKVSEFIGFLSRSVKIDLLKSSDLISFLHQCISGLEHKLVSPYPGAFLDTYLSSQDFIGGLSPEMAGQHIKMLAIDDVNKQNFQIQRVRFRRC